MFYSGRCAGIAAGLDVANHSRAEYATHRVGYDTYIAMNVRL